MARTKLNLKGFQKIKKELGNKAPYKAVAQTAVSEIKKSIANGVSPVRGKRKFRRYSSSYLNQILNGYGLTGRYGKRPLPVNMELSGKMMNSLKYKINAGKISLFFTDKKAEYHDISGVGKRKVKRRLLPTRPGEKLSVRIDKEIRGSIQKLTNRLVKLGNSA